MYKDTIEMDLTNQAIFSLLMKEGFAPLQRTFDEQNTDIAMVNLSISSYGFMLSTGLIADSNFSHTMATALNVTLFFEGSESFLSFSIELLIF